MAKTMSFVLEEEHAQEIDRLSEKTGLSKSYILRNILDRWDRRVIVDNNGHNSDGGSTKEKS